MDIFIHNVIKIKYIDEGYLPDYPYHLISDEEMFEAFMKVDQENVLQDTCFFKDNYVCLDSVLEEDYVTLADEIRYHIYEYLEDNTYKIPDWVYSYMLGECICDTSPVEDRHDYLVLLGLDNVDDEMNGEIQARTLEISRGWINKFPSEYKEHRPPTLFGEPHVIKALRLQKVEIG